MKPVPLQWKHRVLTLDHQGIPKTWIFFFKIILFIYFVVLDCVFFSLCRLSSCGAWAYLPCGRWDPNFPNQGSNQCPLHCRVDS